MRCFQEFCSNERGGRKGYVELVFYVPRGDLRALASKKVRLELAGVKKEKEKKYVERPGSS